MPTPRDERSPASDPTARRGHMADGGVDAVLIILALALATFTVVVVATDAVVPAIVNDRFDIAILTAATLVSAAIAGLDWARHRVAHDPAMLLRSSAFGVLAMLNGLTLVVAVVGADAALGVTLADPGQLPHVANVVGRGVAALLLIASGWLTLSPNMPRFPSVFVLAPAAVVFLVLAGAAMLQDTLPALVAPSALDALAAAPTSPLPLGAAPALVVAQSVIGVGFLGAALVAHRAFGRSGRTGDALLAVGLLVAAFSQVHSAIHPGSYSTVVTTADVLRLTFYGLLLVGVVVESRDDLAQLRAATIEVRRLAEAEFAAAAMEERARLAREIHDGLAQDLWYAKLKQSRLAQVGRLTGESRQLSDEIETAIDSALAEARHAVAAMRVGAETGPLVEILRRLVEDLSDRFALHAELIAEGAQELEISPRVQVELIRIVQEALTNVRKHADATVVRVTVTTDEHLRITIVDNGRGFNTEVGRTGFGLESMRQRAELIGAWLSVTSTLQDGSRVELELPLAAREGRRGI